MIKYVLLFTLMLGFANLTYAQKIKDMFLHIDSTDYIENRNVKLSITLVKKRGKQQIIDLSSSKREWKRFRVSYSGLTWFNNGIAGYDINLTAPDKRKCNIIVTEDDSGLERQISFDLPYISGMKILNTQLTANRDTELDYVLYLSNGRVVSRGGSMLNWRQIKVSSTACSFNLSGSLLKPIIKVPLNQNDLTVQFIQESSGRELARTNFYLAYPTQAGINFSGDDGSDGYNGSDGSFPSGDAGSGSNGRHGGHGLNMSLYVYRKIVNDRWFIVLNGKTSRSNTFYEVLEDADPHIIIRSSGGMGGRGGSGGNGGNGQIDTEKNIDSPRGGNGGNAGDGGNGGDAGQVKIYFHADAYDLLPRFTILNEAGSAGIAGVPGKAGRGDYSKSKLLGTVLALKDGTDGKVGTNGKPGQAAVNELLKLSPEEFESVLKAANLN